MAGLNLAGEVLVLKALVGDAMVDSGLALRTLDESGVRVEDFSEQSTQALFVAVGDTLRAGRPPEMLSLAEATGGRTPRALIFDVLTNWDVGASAQRLAAIRRDSQRRSLALSLRSLVALADNQAVDVAQIIAEIQATLSEIQGGADGVRSADGAVMELIARLEATQRGEFQPVVPTGINALDFVIGGLQKTLTIVGAMPGVGKSALLATIARNISARGVKVGIISLEDTREWIVERILSQEASVPLFLLGTKPLTTGQLERTGAAAEVIYPHMKNVIIDDTHGLGPSQVVASARRMVSIGCKAILVDHLGEIRVERTQRHDLDIMEVLQSLRGISKNYAVPVVVACHLRRREGLDLDNPPKISDFAFSASVERMARVAIGLYKINEDGRDLVGVAILKQTKGPSDMNFALNLNRLSGTVGQTEPTEGMKKLHGSWRAE